MRSDEPGFVSRLPGLDMDANTGAMTATGSAPSRTPSPDNSVSGISSGIPGVGTVLPLSSQANGAEGASPQQPGQNDATVISPGSDASRTYTASADGYVNSGAGDGHNFADQHRYDWQSKPGG
jgi:hypothetical protein